MLKKGLFLTTTASGAIMFAAFAVAQTDTTTNTTAPVTITGISKTSASSNAATPVKVPLKSTYTASVITKKVLENESPAKTAQEVLAREPSIFVTNNGPGGVNTNVTFRSFNSGQFAETYGGIGLNDAFNGAVTAQADNDNNTLVTSNDFESVQLYRGINNPSVNSYNSLGGTINYVPRQPTDTFGGEVGGNYGSFNTIGYHVTLNTGLVDGVKQVFSFERQNSDGWTQNDKNSGSNLFYGFDAPLNNGATNIYGSFIYNTSAGLVNQLLPVDLLSKYGDTYQLPSSDYLKQNTSTNFAAIGGITQQFTSYLSGDFKAFLAENDYVRTSYCNRAFSNTQDYNISDCNHASNHLYGYYTTTFGFQPSLKLSLPFNTVQVGSNLTFAHLHSREFFANSFNIPQNPQPDGSGNDFWNEHDVRTLGSVYIQDEISLFDDRLKITPGLKYLYAITKDTDQAAYYYPYTGSVSNTEHYLSPTLGMSFAITPQLVAYASYGQNVKFPDITSYYNNIATNSGSVQPVTVKPEYVKDYEVGLRYENGPIVAEANYYREDFLNTFVTTTDLSTGNSTTGNGGSSRYEGEELQLADDFGHIGGDMVPGDFAGYLNFAHNSAIYTSSYTDQFSGISVTSGQSIANVPQNLLSAGANWTNNGYYVGVDMRYIGSQVLNNAAISLPSNFKNGAYVITDLTFADTIPLHMGIVKAVKLTLNLDNIFGVHYYAQSDVNQYYSTGANYKEGIIGAPRAVYGSVAFKF